MFETPEQAAFQYKRRPSLGDYIAELLIPDGAPLTRDAATSSGHINIWCDKNVLAGYRTDVFPVTNILVP